MDPATRTAKWRDQRRDDGYKYLGLWLPEGTKDQLSTLAKQRRQELHETIADALAALAAREEAPPAARVTWEAVEALIAQRLADVVAPPQTERRVHTRPQSASQTVPQPPQDVEVLIPSILVEQPPQKKAVMLPSTPPEPPAGWSPPTLCPKCKTKTPARWNFRDTYALCVRGNHQLFYPTQGDNDNGNDV